MPPSPTSRQVYCTTHRTSGSTSQTVSLQCSGSGGSSSSSLSVGSSSRGLSTAHGAAGNFAYFGCAAQKRIPHMCVSSAFASALKPPNPSRLPSPAPRQHPCQMHRDHLGAAGLRRLMMLRHHMPRGDQGMQSRAGALQHCQWCSLAQLSTAHNGQSPWACGQHAKSAPAPHHHHASPPPTFALQPPPAPFHPYPIPSGPAWPATIQPLALCPSESNSFPSPPLLPLFYALALQYTGGLPGLADVRGRS